MLYNISPIAQIKLDKLCLQPQRIEGDGNCFFRSISHQLTLKGINLSHEELRYDLYRSFELNDKVDDIKLEKEDKNIGNDGTWIDNELQIKRMAHIIGKRIVIIDSKNSNLFVINDEVHKFNFETTRLENDITDYFDDTIFIIHHRPIHFESVNFINPECITKELVDSLASNDYDMQDINLVDLKN